MKNANSALGIYLSKTGQETPQEELSVRNTANQYQLVFTCGTYFIMVNNFSGNKQLIPLMRQVSKIIIDQIEIEENENLFSYLPDKDIIENSQSIFRGPYGLQSVYTLGKGDVLNLNGEIFGVAANYSTDSTEYITKLVVPYPSSVLAEEAYNHLISNLDPYHEIIEKHMAPDLYWETAYTKMPALIDLLRLYIGDEAFFSGIQACYSENLFGIITLN